MEPQLQKSAAETKVMMESLAIDKGDAEKTQKIVAEEETIASQ